MPGFCRKARLMASARENGWERKAFVAGEGSAAARRGPATQLEISVTRMQHASESGTFAGRSVAPSVRTVLIGTTSGVSLSFFVREETYLKKLRAQVCGHRSGFL